MRVSSGGLRLDLPVAYDYDTMSATNGVTALNLGPKGREVTGELNVALDLNAWMLLRFDPVQGKRRWIAASRISAIGPWTALRAALYSRCQDDPVAR